MSLLPAPYPAPFTIRRERELGSKRDAREKMRLKEILELLVEAGEVSAINLKKGRSYYIPLQPMEDRLW